MAKVLIIKVYNAKQSPIDFDRLQKWVEQVYVCIINECFMRYKFDIVRVLAALEGLFLFVPQGVCGVVADHTWQVVMYGQQIDDNRMRNDLHNYSSLKQAEVCKPDADPQSALEPQPEPSCLVEIICNQPCENKDANKAVDKARTVCQEALPK